MKNVIQSGIVLLVLFILLFFASTGAQADKEPLLSGMPVLSYCFADVNQDGQEELLTIEAACPGQENEEGEAYGNYLRIYRDFSDLSHRGSPIFDFDLSYIKPMQVQTGDVNRDGKEEIAITAYKETPFHPIPAKRPFFYALTNGELEKVWLGSRLSRPFTDFALIDLDKDGFAELLALEKDREGSCIAALYRWEGFGFDLYSDAALSGENAHFPKDRIYPPQEIQIRTTDGLFQAEMDRSILHIHPAEPPTLQKGNL